VFTKLSSKDSRGTEEAVATLRQLISETEELVGARGGGPIPHEATYVQRRMKSIFMRFLVHSFPADD
jgi:hypothetical protein